MKKRIVIGLLMATFLLTSCGSEKIAGYRKQVTEPAVDASEGEDVSDVREEPSESAETSKTEELGGTVAKALNVETDDRDVWHLVSAIESIGITGVEKVYIKRAYERIMYVEASDDKVYNILLSLGNSLVWLQDMDTYEYLIRSER